MIEQIENLKEQIRLAFTKIKNSEGSPKDLKIGKMLNDLKELNYKEYEPILQEYKNDVFAAYKEANPKEFIKKKSEIVILEDIGADGRTSRIRFSGIDDKKVKVKKPGESRIRKVTPKGDGSCCEFNGSFNGKGRTVLNVTKYIVLNNYQRYINSNISDKDIENEINAMFEGCSKNQYGIVKTIQEAKNLSIKYNRFFLKEADQIKLPGGTKLAVSKEWGANNMPDYIERANSKGFKIKVV